VAQTEHGSPPPADRRPVRETIHGVEIQDPYRWLEDGASEETQRWVQAQNEHAAAVLSRLPGSDRVRARLESLFNIGFLGTPVEAGPWLFYGRRSAGQNQTVLRARRGVDGEDRVLVDPNAEDPRGTTAIDWWYPSWDGRYVAFGLSTGGNEESTLRIVETASGRVLPDAIPHTRFATVAWLPESDGFYYTGNVKSLAGDPSSAAAYYHRAVYRHRLGTSDTEDEEIFPDDGDPETVPAVAVSRDGRWLVVSINRGWSVVRLALRDMEAAQAEFRVLNPSMEAVVQVITAGADIYLHTNWEAPRYRLLRLDPHHPDPESWQEVISERPDSTLEHVAVARDRLVLGYLHNATSTLEWATREGREGGSIDLPQMHTLTALSACDDGDDVYYGLESFTVPPEVLRDRPGRSAPQLWERVEADIDVDAFTTEQVWFPSKDGTRVSMFITRGRNVPKDGSAPGLLTGYGGFNINRTPLFDRGMILWLEAGGVVALPNLRGGGEYGEEWHEAGKLDKKQNVFDDFIAAAEYLIAEGYVSHQRLGIMGGSNGGLLVGAAMTQRPDLFRAVGCLVPLLDMIRYHHFLIARLWIPEYGSSDDPSQLPFLFRYSPYHHVSPDAEYPAVLFMTADSDTRVDPMHARKMAALLQAHGRTKGPVLLRIETEAGHGAGKPVSKLVDERTDLYAFLMWQLGLTPPA